MTRFLLTAATPWEAGPLRARVGVKAALLETGMGALRTERALAAWTGPTPDVVVSAGFAGALQPGMRSGDLVIDPHGAPQEWLGGMREAAREAGLDFHMGRIVTKEAVLASPAEKRSLGKSSRAAAVDMESGAVRSWAEGRGASFLAVRVVLDEVDDRLPDGVPESDSLPALIRYALARWRDIPLLTRLAIRQRRGIRGLAVFLSLLLDRIEGGTAGEG